MPTRAIVLFPTGDQLGAVEAIRQQYDPLANVIAGHITLVFPFEGDDTAEQLRAHVEASVADVSPFAVRLEGVTTGGDGYLFLNVAAGRDRVIALHDRLYTGMLARHLSHERAYMPHLTLGRIADSAALAAGLSDAA